MCQWDANVTMQMMTFWVDVVIMPDPSLHDPPPTYEVNMLSN